MVKIKFWDNEKIILVKKFSKCVLIRKFFDAFVAGIFGVIIGIFLGFLLSKNNIFIFSIIFFILFFSSIIFYFIFLWKESLLLITNRRIIFYHKKSLFSSKKVEVRLENISEIVSVKKNFLNSIFNFGTIVISPVSGTEKFRIPFIPNSEKVVEVITKVSYKGTIQEHDSPEQILSNDPSVFDFVFLDEVLLSQVFSMESPENRGAFDVLKRNKVFFVARKGMINIPKYAICNLPSLRVENFLKTKLSKISPDVNFLLVGF